MLLVGVGCLQSGCLVPALCTCKWARDCRLFELLTPNVCSHLSQNLASKLFICLFIYIFIDFIYSRTEGERTGRDGSLPVHALRLWTPSAAQVRGDLLVQVVATRAQALGARGRVHGSMRVPVGV